MLMSSSEIFTDVNDLNRCSSFTIRNQAEFGKLVERTLQCLAQFRRIGDVEILMMYSIRNKVGTVESYRCVVTGIDYVT